MNFQPLFTTARVITAVYRVASTTLLLLYLAQRLNEGRVTTRRRNQMVPGQEYRRRPY